MGVTIGPVSVEARDKQPSVAPHKIGVNPSKDGLEWFFAIGQDGDIYPDDGYVPVDENSGLKFGEEKVVGVVHRLGGNAVGQGEFIRDGGQPGGLACSEQIACSDQLECGTLDKTTGTIAGFIWKGDLSLSGDPDGEYTVKTYLQVEAKGWV